MLSFAPHNDARYRQPLRIPPVLQPTRSDAEADYFDLTEREADVEILPGVNTRIWGYNGLFPGPTLIGRKGRQSVVRVKNALANHTAVHLHGGMTHPDSDGFPTDMIPPGAERTYTYSNLGRPSTLWYHDHAMDHTGHNIYRGLAGFYLLQDPVEEALRLPSGAYEIPLMIQQRQFARDGSFVYRTRNHGGAIGDVTLVNGVPWPKLEVAARKYRFRVLNASNSTKFTLALSSGEPMHLIGTDSGLLPAPVPCAVIPLSMAERADIVIDFSKYRAGSAVTLRGLMRFHIVRSESDDSELPSKLAAEEILSEHAAVATRTFGFGARLERRFPSIVWTINRHGFDPARVAASPKLGDIEIWRFINASPPLGTLGMLHPVHVHLSPFRVLRRNGRPPLRHETGWKDTVAVDRGEHVEVIVKFEGYRGRYLLHCHNLEHEDHNMMARFDVV